MAFTPNETFARPIMFLCLGAALIILMLRSSELTNSAARLQRSIVSSPKPSNAVATPGVSPPPSSQLVVDLSDRRVYVLTHNRPVSFYPIAVGQKGWETPIGKFQVIQMQQNPEWVHPITNEVVRSGADNPLGSRWIGFWTNDREQIGFHGTAQENLIGQAVSHGCIRMRNRDVEALYEQIQMGTPVMVRP